MMPGEPTTLQQTECDWQILGTFLILLIDSLSSFISRLLACIILWPFLLATTVCKYSTLQIPDPELSNLKLSALQSSGELVLKFSICTLSVNVTFQVRCSECCSLQLICCASCLPSLEASSLRSLLPSLPPPSPTLALGLGPLQSQLYSRLYSFASRALWFVPALWLVSAVPRHSHVSVPSLR